MSLPYKVSQVSNGETLYPSLLAKNFRRVQADLNNSMARKYVYSSATFDFSGVTDTSVFDELRFLFTPPVAFDIVGIEIEAFTTSAPISSITISSTISGFVTQTLAITTSTLASKTDNFTASSAGNAQVGISLAVTAGSTPWTLGACRVTVHYRTSRGNAGDVYTPYTPTLLPGPTTAINRASLNTEFSNLAAAVSNNTSANKCMRFSVYTLRSIAGAVPTSSADTRIPQTLRRVAKVDIGVVAGGASTWQVDFGETAPSFGTQITATASPAAANTLAIGSTTVVVLQSFDVPNQASSDSLVRFSRFSGAVGAPLLYAVVYFT